MKKENSTILEKIKSVSEGLYFRSETTYPFKTFAIEGIGPNKLTAQKLLEVKKHHKNTPIKVVEVDDFFRIATKNESWHNEEEKEEVENFKKLVKVLKENLKDMKVFRVGKIEIDVYIIGKAVTGDYAGVATKVVET